MIKLIAEQLLQLDKAERNAALSKLYDEIPLFAGAVKAKLRELSYAAIESSTEQNNE